MVLQFIFIPILRQESFGWVRTHNQHPMRADNKRNNHVAGIPNAIYAGIEKNNLGAAFGPRQFGFTPAEGMLDGLDSMVANYGITPLLLLLIFTAYTHRLSDQDLYISPESQRWCKSTLIALGKHDPILATDFLTQSPRREALIPPWYTQLIELARIEGAKGPDGSLRSVEKPRGGYSWVHRQLVYNQLDAGQSQA